MLRGDVQPAPTAPVVDAASVATPTPTSRLPPTFRALRSPTFRVWAGGAFISNVGTWMQRTAQDWLVLAELTNRNATSLGVVLALQFGPPLLLLPLTGLAADRFDRRTLLVVTQGLMALLSLALGVLTLAGAAGVGHVYAFAFFFGCAAAFDAPARQAFVSDLVDDADLANAVALNSASFNAARLVGPAVAGLLIAGIGTGWVFVVNAASFGGVLVSLLRLKRRALRPRLAVVRGSTGLGDGLRLVRRRSDILVVLTMLFLIGAFGLNFPIFISTMAVNVFHQDASRFGLLASMMAVGSVAGALLAARRKSPGIRPLVLGALLFGAALGLAAAAPDELLFGLCLAVVGLATQTFTTTANGVVQLSTEPHLRGRVLAIHLAIAMGSTLVGAPLVGFIADARGPRAALGVGAAAGFAAALVGLLFVRRGGRLRVGESLA